MNKLWNPYFIPPNSDQNWDCHFLHTPTLHFQSVKIFHGLSFQIRSDFTHLLSLASYHAGCSITCSSLFCFFPNQSNFSLFPIWLARKIFKKSDMSFLFLETSYGFTAIQFTPLQSSKHPDPSPSQLNQICHWPRTTRQIVPGSFFPSFSFLKVMLPCLKYSSKN